MALANRYNVSVHSIEMWRRYEGWPHAAVRREGVRLVFDHVAVDEWLRSRPVSTTGFRPRWLEVVGHPSLHESTA